MKDLHGFLHARLKDGLLPWAAQSEAAERFSCGCAAVEEAALERGWLPARYQRNRGSISVAEQLKLFRSRVAVIGCGGLGGYVIEELARLGVGRLTAVDPDVFEEHNLNRQLLSSPRNLGLPKVEAAQARVAEINPAVTFDAVKKSFCAANGPELLAGVNAAVDALDSIPCRLELAAACAGAGVPLVHAAIGGWYGQVVTQLPGGKAVGSIYRNWRQGKGIEKKLGNPSFTPAVAASLQAAEVCKLLLGRGETLAGRKLVIDLLDMELHVIPYAPE